MAPRVPSWANSPDECHDLLDFCARILAILVHAGPGLGDLSLGFSASSVFYRRCLPRISQAALTSTTDGDTNRSASPLNFNVNVRRNDIKDPSHDEMEALVRLPPFHGQVRFADAHASSRNFPTIPAFLNVRARLVRQLRTASVDDDQNGDIRVFRLRVD